MTNQQKTGLAIGGTIVAVLVAILIYLATRPKPKSILQRVAEAETAKADPAAAPTAPKPLDTGLTLQAGVNGPETKALQDQLNLLGYGLVSDGSFGPTTTTAVTKATNGQSWTTLAQFAALVSNGLVTNAAGQGPGEIEPTLTDKVKSGLGELLSSTGYF